MVPPTLRKQLEGGRCTLVPGVYDCVSAKLAEASGFGAVAISGYCVEASLLGQPDLGFSNLTDVALVADRIASAVSVPVICDADTGYGGANHVRATVRRPEKAGVQGLHIEDQAGPKRCGGFAGRRVVPTEEMVAKVEAAVDARRGRDLVLIARTDARESLGVDEAIGRLNAYLRAGADVAFLAEDYPPEEIRRVAAAVNGPLAICAGVPGWSASFETRETYEAWGVALVVYPFASLYPAVKAMRDFYGRMAADEGVTREHAADALVDFSWFGRFVGADTWLEREGRFADAARSGRQDTLREPRSS
ncbi:MAG: isocitrate lyase/PEP mutase family protein [Chloroflexota bacterium]|nr:isocitrate lyase/PEP mutase family protein [Chloroflexota bacterium]